MVPDDPNHISTAIEAALHKLDARAAADRDTVAMNHDLPSATRDAGVTALDGVRNCADDVMEIVRAADLRPAP